MHISALTSPTARRKQLEDELRWRRQEARIPCTATTVTVWPINTTIPLDQLIPDFIPEGTAGGLLIYTLPRTTAAIPKFYAIRIGEYIGIFTRWAAVDPLVTGYPGAAHASFTTSHEAAAFIWGPDYLNLAPWFYYPGSKLLPEKRVVAFTKLTYHKQAYASPSSSYPHPLPRHQPSTSFDFTIVNDAVRKANEVHSKATARNIAAAAVRISPVVSPYALPAAIVYDSVAEEPAPPPPPSTSGLTSPKPSSLPTTPTIATIDLPSDLPSEFTFDMSAVADSLQASMSSERRALFYPPGFQAPALVDELPDRVIEHLDSVLRLDEDAVDIVAAVFAASRNIIGFKTKMMAAGLTEAEVTPLYRLLKA